MYSEERSTGICWSVVLLEICSLHHINNFVYSNEAIDTLKAVNIWSHDYVSHTELRGLKGCIVINIITVAKFGSE
jgi:hypothetical protein